MQETLNIKHATKCNCNMRSLNNQTQEKLPYVQIYTYALELFKEEN